MAIEEKEVELEWGRGKRLKRRSPIIRTISPPCPLPCPPQHHPRRKEEYVVLEPGGHNNNKSCAEHSMSLHNYIYTIRPHTYSLRPANSHREVRTLHFPERTGPLTEGHCHYNLRPLSLPAQMQDDKENCYLLSNLADSDEREKYATIAVNKFNSYRNWNPSALNGTLALVKCGLISVGHISDGLVVLHFNFEARDTGALSAPVKTFFTEIIITTGNVVNDVFVFCLGPASSLPDEAKPFGCLYCCSNNVHHPDNCGLPYVHNGRECHWKDLKSETRMLRDFIRDSEEEGFVPMFSHPGVKYFGRPYEGAPTALATVALSLFNSETKGAKFKLVKTGFSGLGDTSCGLVLHLNFEAKNIEDPDSPTQTFFAEVIRCRVYIFAVFCKCLGPSDIILPGKPIKHGCIYCARANVHHPPGPGYINGREYHRYES